MPVTDIGSAVASDLTNQMVDYSVDASQTDAGGEQREFTYQNTKFNTWFGYYKTIPELKIAVDTKANWVVGNGYEADEITSIILDGITGFGKDTFNSILENMERMSPIGQDAYAEIIRDDDDVLANLKPLDPSTIVVVHGWKGRIKRYEQVSKVKGKANKVILKENMFVLSHNRAADEVHGISIIPALEPVILARNEAMKDWRKCLHWNVMPRWKIALDTDDDEEIASFKMKYDTANKLGENMYIPKGTVEMEVLAVAPNETLNPLAWIAQLNDYFFQAVGVPQIVVGNAKAFTDASAKIVYLAFEQRIRGRQLYVEEQVLNQLNVVIKLTFPAKLENEAISDQPNMEIEEEPPEQPAQKKDTTAELKGNK